MPKYNPDLIRQISEANDIVDIVSNYVPLKQKGKVYTACCPFHNEKTPSFHVDREKQLFHCFGCGAGGDLYTFLMQKENLSFTEAIEFLAERAGIELPVMSGAESQVENAKAQERKRLMQMHRLAANYYYKNLITSQEALGYLIDRGIDSKTIKQFGIGYAPEDWSSLYRLLSSKGFSDKEIIESGLALAGKNNSRPYDRFRGRVVFPIQNVMDHVIGFGARKIKEEDRGPKYLNSPETPIFSKGTQLFNLNRAKKELRNQPLLLVEGYMDVVALSKFGFNNAAAALGTAFTIDHAKLISRYTKDVILCFDGDSAGEKATFKALEVLSGSDLNIRVLRLPVEHDPDSYIREYGTEAFNKFIKQALPVIDFRLSILERDFDLNTSGGVLSYVSEGLRVIAKLNQIEQDYYSRLIAQKSGIDVDAIRSQLEINNSVTRTPPKKKVLSAQSGVRQPKSPIKPKEKRRIPPDLVDAQKLFLLFCYLDPERLFTSGITENKMTNGFFRWLYKRLKELNEVQPSPSAVLENAEDRKYERMVSSLLFNADQKVNLQDKELYERVISIIQKYAREAEIIKLQKELINADEESQNELFEQLRELKKEGWV